jgi:hypothetical protein
MNKTSQLGPALGSVQPAANSMAELPLADPALVCCWQSAHPESIRQCLAELGGEPVALRHRAWARGWAVVGVQALREDVGPALELAGALHPGGGNRQPVVDGVRHAVFDLEARSLQEVLLDRLRDLARAFLVRSEVIELGELSWLRGRQHLGEPFDRRSHPGEAASASKHQERGGRHLSIVVVGVVEAGDLLVLEQIRGQ